MKFDAPDAPIYAVPGTRWWLWALAALALHLGAALLVWVLLQSPLRAVDDKRTVASEQLGAFDVQRLVWVDAGLQVTAPLPDVRPTPAKAKPIAANAQTPAPTPLPTAARGADLAVMQSPKSQVQPVPTQAPQPPVLPINTVPEETVTTGSKGNATIPAVEPVGLAVSAPGDARPAPANSAPSVLQAYSPPPNYPPLSMRLGEQGTVLLRVQVGLSGQALAVYLQQSSGFERLDRAALQTVSAWRFVPAMAAGQAQTAWFEVPVRFELR